MTSEQEAKAQLSTQALNGDLTLMNRTIRTRSGQFMRTGWWWVEEIVKTHQFGRLVIRCVYCHLVQWGETFSDPVSGYVEKRRCVRCGASSASDDPVTRVELQEAVLTLPDANPDSSERQSETLKFSDESFNRAVAISFRLMRHILRLSQRDLSERSGHVRTYISKIERGSALPTVSTLRRFCFAFGVTEQYFIEIVCGVYAALTDSQKGRV